MIKFFRHIRQNLIIENKTSKYLKYAVGEIVLVVIGILIALQINNWNEERKQNKQEIIFLQNLRDDLITQIESQDIYISFESIIIKNPKDIMLHYELNKGFKNMDSIYPKLNDLSVRWTFVNSNTTLLELINSGDINIISNKSLKKELIEFNEIVKRFASNTINNNTNLIDNYIVPNIINNSDYAATGYSKEMKEQFQKYFPMGFLQLDQFNHKELVDANLNEPNKRLMMINNVVFRSGMASMQKSGNETLKEKAVQLKNLINEELNRR
ncbi:DUF6090 family protein [Aegicerativicinus sediminis]|uniref:DUF6090 family protein n=1 Tax=Aegicerativicinus sediminis TaxID=2893202 RepID=UPI001E53DC00|nr:DUF6090 family protein [Aegicerativicinus sediminis]